MSGSRAKAFRPEAGKLRRTRLNHAGYVCIGLSAWLLAVHTQAPADSTILAPRVKPARTTPASTTLANPPTPQTRRVADSPPAAFTASRRTPASAPAGASGRALSWPGVPAATFYDVILWQHGKRVLDLWPSTPRVLLPKHWTFGGQRFTLAAGGYRWFVYPATGTRAAASYGSLAAHGDLR